MSRRTKRLHPTRVERSWGPGPTRDVPPGTMDRRHGCYLGEGAWLSEGWVILAENIVPSWAVRGKAKGGWARVYLGGYEKTIPNPDLA